MCERGGGGERRGGGGGCMCVREKGGGVHVPVRFCVHILQPVP